MDDRIIIFRDGSWMWESDSFLWPPENKDYITIDAPLFPSMESEEEIELFRQEIRTAHYNAFIMGQGI